MLSLSVSIRGKEEGVVAIPLLAAGLRVLRGEQSSARATSWAGGNELTLRATRRRDGLGSNSNQPAEEPLWP